MILTGPVTMMQWSFARDDQPREAICQQIALAIRDKVQALEAAKSLAASLREVP